MSQNHTSPCASQWNPEHAREREALSTWDVPFSWPEFRRRISAARPRHYGMVASESREGRTLWDELVRREMEKHPEEKPCFDNVANFSGFTKTHVPLPKQPTARPTKKRDRAVAALAREIEKLLDSGLSSRLIGEKLGCRAEYVRTVRQRRRERGDGT